MPVLCALMRSEDEADAYLLRRCGYGQREDSPRLVLMAGIQSSPEKSTYDPHDWGRDGTRTRLVAHEYIEKNWDSLKSGDVIDVEFILGETATAKTSERFEAPL
jgi:hypothetical protein